MDPDMNKYDLEHAVVASSQDERREVWEQTYRDAWRTYYTPEHIETVLRRGAAAKRRSPAVPAHS